MSKDNIILHYMEFRGCAISITCDSDKIIRSHISIPNNNKLNLSNISCSESIKIINHNEEISVTLVNESTDNVLYDINRLKILFIDELTDDDIDMFKRHNEQLLNNNTDLKLRSIDYLIEESTHVINQIMCEMR